MRFLFRSFPRAFALASDSHALVIEQDPAAKQSGTPTVLIRLVTLQPAPEPAGQLDLLSDDDVAQSGPAPEPLPLDPLQSFRPFYATVPSPQTCGTLGLIESSGQIFLAIVHEAVQAAEVRPGERVERIKSVEFYSLSSPHYDVISTPSSAPQQANQDPVAGLQSIVNGLQSYQAGDYAGSSGTSVGSDAQGHPCEPVKKMLTDGTFYFARTFDITSRLQTRVHSPTHPLDRVSHGWVWNGFMAQSLVTYRNSLLPAHRAILDEHCFMIATIRGFASTRNVSILHNPLNDGQTANLSIISRLSCRRAGTRFNARGIDDDGNVANFVESETIFYSRTRPVFSYIQLRGSVPIFWEQAPGLIPGQQKISVTRGPEATEPAFEKHTRDVLDRYENVHVVNLLSWEKGGEADLMRRFHSHITQINKALPDPKKVRETQYDFNVLTKSGGYDTARGVCDLVRTTADDFQFCVVEDRSPDPIIRQNGVFRTNCLDCLDRTNLVQTLIGQMALEAYFNQTGAFAQEHIQEGQVQWELPAPSISIFWDIHNVLWADNGDALSYIYAGTGALKSSFTRTGKMNFAGALSDATKSATRLFLNNFADDARQMLTDRVLGRGLDARPVHLSLNTPQRSSAALAPRRKMQTKTGPEDPLVLWVGTFNLNGLSTGLSISLRSWLWPDNGAIRPDIFAVGFQEMVPLNAQMIMNTDSSAREEWETKILLEINANETAREEAQGNTYILLRGAHLVGASLSIFVRQKVLDRIKNVEASDKKTGMSGVAGNKGATAIRFDVGSSSLCFVAAHLAAGSESVYDRNRDYAAITNGLQFTRGRSIDSHDVVIWLGDFNYRVGIDYDNAMRMVRMGDLRELLDKDQLKEQKRAGATFQGFSEGAINFPPTYRFEIESDNYDRSEKRRVPSWCDRVLWKIKAGALQQLSYNSSEVKCSDHRPVYSHFEWHIGKEGEARFEKAFATKAATGPPQPPPRQKATKPVPPPRSNTSSTTTAADLLIDLDEPAKSNLKPGSTLVPMPRPPVPPPRHSAKPIRAETPPTVPLSRANTLPTVAPQVPPGRSSQGSSRSTSPNVPKSDSFAGLDELVFGSRASSRAGSGTSTPTLNQAAPFNNRVGNLLGQPKQQQPSSVPSTSSPLTSLSVLGRELPGMVLSHQQARGLVPAAPARSEHEGSSSSSRSPRAPLASIPVASVRPSIARELSAGRRSSPSPLNLPPTLSKPPVPRKPVGLRAESRRPGDQGDLLDLAD